MKYNEILNNLFKLNASQGMKLGLTNVEILNKILDNPSKNYKSIHIAGTNGKGSVTTKIAKGLEFEGYKVGLYISPHISTFRERISVNGKIISEDEVCKHAINLFSLIEKHNVNATFFELTTLMALLYFAEKEVDYAVLETGLGGRLDATNIVFPELSVITSISLDHTEILGQTLEEIAHEKAGIIKTGAPVILGPRTDPLPQLLKTPFTQITGKFEIFEEENYAIAQSALHCLGVSNESAMHGLKYGLPCRMEQVSASPLIVMDVAHNPDGLRQLFKSLKAKYGDRKIRMIFGLSKNKDKNACLSLIKENAHFFYIVESTNGRGVPVNELYEAMLDLGVSQESLIMEKSIERSVQVAISSVKESEILLICGTFFIMRDARRSLGIKEPYDELDMNERKL